METQLKELRENNFEDKVRLVQNESIQFKTLREYIDSTLKKTQKLYSDASILINKIVDTRKVVEATKEKIAILADIGNTESEEWNQFIHSGQAYREGANIDPKICPYCRQKIEGKAASIVAAYGTYLSDKSQCELDSLIKDKEALLSLVNSIGDYKITESLDLIFNSRCDGEELRFYINKVLDIFKLSKKMLSSFITEERQFEQPVCTEPQQLLDKLFNIESDYTKEIAELKSKQLQKTSDIESIQRDIRPLMEKKAISSQREQFEDWFSKIDAIEELKRCQSELSTRTVSSIAKNASQTLITENLKTKFQDELNALGLDKLKVELKDAGASRGQSFTELCLVNTNMVSDILSEGEQKGVALALFIAERRMQLSNNPIILDDPVNSLDNVITAKFVDRLCTLGCQIIIFSHNLLLLSALENLKGAHSCGVNQRSSCNKSSLHVYMYNVYSYGRDRKGVLMEKSQDNVKNTLNSASRLLNNCMQSANPNNDCIAIAGQLRHTIELMIDEKVFVNQVPVKFHGRKNSIQWDRLKCLNPDKALIDTLNTLYNRLSGGDLHSGIEHSENPIEYEELLDIFNSLNELA